jgi:hypothetical protein
VLSGIEGDTVHTNIKKAVSKEGYIDLSFPAKGGRVDSDSYMPLIVMILLLPASCALSSPVALMTFDKVANRNEFQSGSAILWSLLALGMWFAIIYAYNHRRKKISGKLRIIPKVSVYGTFLHPFEPAHEFSVRRDDSLGYSSHIHYVAVKTKKNESRLTNLMSEEQAQELVNEINKNR